MASQVDICNLALTRVGAATITSLTDGTREANLCNILYDEVAEEVMAEGAWSTCTFRATLNQTTNTPVYEYTYEYQLPTNPRILKFLEVQDDRSLDITYDIEEDKLLTDEGSVKVKYIGFLEDPGSYGAYLKAAIVSRLSHELAYTITGSASVAEKMWQRYQVDLRKGLAQDGGNGSSVTIFSDDLTRGR